MNNVIRSYIVHYIDETGRDRTKKIELTGGGQQVPIIVEDTLRLGIPFEEPDGSVLIIPPHRITGIRYRRGE